MQYDRTRRGLSSWIAAIFLLSVSTAVADDATGVVTVSTAESTPWYEEPGTARLDDAFWRKPEVTVPPFVPSMIGDFFNGTPTRLTGRFELDRLVVIADDLDAPGMLPPSGSMLTITESGPVGIFSSSLGSAVQLQQLLRSGGSLPLATPVGQVVDDATMTTSLTVAEVQALLSSTGEPFDIIPLLTPPTSYEASVDSAFTSRNGVSGTTQFESQDSGALLQAGVDSLSGGEDFDAFYFYSYGVDLNLVLPGVGSGITGVEKLAQGSSLLPQDRLFFHYSFLDDLTFAGPSRSYSRFTPGVEKTFLDGRGSVELRMPFASDISSNSATGGLTNSGDVEFGNLQLYVKSLLGTWDDMAFSGGLGVSLPTERDLTVRLPDSTPLVVVENKAVHLQPFLGAAFSSGDRAFAQAVLQFDFDVNGNPVSINQTRAGLAHRGSLRSSSMVYIDVSTGYWFVRESPASSHWLTGLASVFEVHHNQSLGNRDSVFGSGLVIRGASDSFSSTNIVLGLIAQLGGNTNLSAGYVVPVSQGTSQLFDGGLRASIDWRFR